MGDGISMLLPPITKKQTEIIELVYRFRFLNRIHIQHVLHHKDYKTINIWLRDLTEKQYLERIYVNTFEGHTKPAIYNLGINGIRLLRMKLKKDKKELRKYYRERFTSDTFQKQCLLIADIYLHVMENYTNIPTFYTRADYPVNGIIRDFLPSFGFIRQEKRKRVVYVCELIPYGRPRGYYPARIHQLFTFCAHEVDTRLLFICPTYHLCHYIDQLVQKCLDSEELTTADVQVVTVREVLENGK